MKTHLRSVQSIVIVWLVALLVSKIVETLKQDVQLKQNSLQYYTITIVERQHHHHDNDAIVLIVPYIASPLILL